MPSYEKAISGYLKQLGGSLSRLPVKEMARVVKALDEVRKQDRAVYIFGNGGSASTASHFASDLNKGAICEGKPRFRAFCLNDNIPVLTAWANDANYESMFYEQVDNFVRKGDVVVAISGSGDSRNVLMAVGLARIRGAFTVGFSGFDGGKLKDLADLAVVVPSNVMEQIEDTHLAIEHIITTCLRRGN